MACNCNLMRPSLALAVVNALGTRALAMASAAMPLAVRARGLLVTAQHAQSAQSGCCTLQSQSAALWQSMAPVQAPCKLWPPSM